MAERFFAFLSRNINGLHEAAFLLAFFALISQLLGLFRDRFLAHVFGAGTLLDVYYASFRIPDLIFVSIASTVSMFIVIPFLSERMERGSDAARCFMESIVNVFMVMMVVVSVVAFFLVPFLSAKLFPTLATSLYGADLTLITRILLLSPIILGVSNLLASITQLERRFFVYALSPALYNCGIIIGIAVFYPLMGLQGLAYGVVLGALLHLGIQLPALLRSPLMPRISFHIDWQEIGKVLRMSIPRTIALASGQIALLALVVVAGRMAEGSLTIFNLALNLQGAPLAVIGISYSVAAFPTLARFFSRGEREAFIQHIMQAARHILFWSFPTLILFIVLRAQIVRTILGSGAFSWADTRLTAAAVALFLISLAAQGLVMLFVRGYYAAGKTLKPLLVNGASGIMIIFLAWGGLFVFRSVPFVQYFFESLLRVDGVAGTEVLILALAYSFGFILNAIVLWVFFEQDFGANPFSISVTTLWQSLASSVFAGAAAYVLLAVGDGFFNVSTLTGIFSQGLFAGCGGIVVGIAMLVMFKNEELASIVQPLRHHFWKSESIVPEQQEL